MKAKPKPLETYDDFFNKILRNPYFYMAIVLLLIGIGYWTLRSDGTRTVDIRTDQKTAQPPPVAPQVSNDPQVELANNVTSMFSTLILITAVITILMFVIKGFSNV